MIRTIFFVLSIRAIHFRVTEFVGRKAVTPKTFEVASTVVELTSSQVFSILTVLVYNVHIVIFIGVVYTESIEWKLDGVFVGVTS